MTRHSWWSGKYWHPSERDLLLFVNGEGGAKLARAVRGHLEGCWSCSMKRDRMADAIAAFMRGRETALDGERLSEAADRRFVSRLGRVAEQSASNHSASRRKSPGRDRRRIFLQAAVVVCIFASGVLVWLRFTSVPSVSAREILIRAERSEAKSLDAVTDPVVHQRLRVTRRVHGQMAESVGLETWRDPKTNRWKHKTEELSVSTKVSSKGLGAETRARKTSGTVDHPVVVDLQQVLRLNDMHQNPLSASGFSGWRSRLKDPIESIAETELSNGEEALTIATLATQPLPKDSVVKAELVIRLKDWHPVEERLSVQETNGSRSYEIREDVFEVVALSSLDASIFGSPSTALPLMTQGASLDRSLETQSQVNSSLELEVSLFYQLHRAEACSGEEVKVVRTETSRFEVRGVVGSLKRKQELTQALAEFPDLSIAISTAEDADKGAPDSAEVSEIQTSPMPEKGDSVSGGPPISEHLLKYFGQLETAAARHANAVEFSNKIIVLSEKAYDHAWELQRLAEHFESVSWKGASPATLTLFRMIVQDHFRELSKALNSCDTLLRPVLLSLRNTNLEVGHPALNLVSATESWDVQTMRIFHSVISADNVIKNLFAETGAKVDLQESSSQLLAALPTILHEVRSAEAHLPALVPASDTPLISRKPLPQAKP